MSKLEQAVSNLASAMRSDMSEPMWHFNCGEADLIASVLAAGGHIDEAATVILSHAVYGDDQDEYDPEVPTRTDGSFGGDAHGFIVAAYEAGTASEDHLYSGQGGDGARARELALEYVRERLV